MPKQPIMQFKSQAQLDSCLKEWQTRLFLDDWTICARLHDASEMTDCEGDVERFYTRKAAYIRISTGVKHEADSFSLEKECAEHSLVHELLHCKDIDMEGSVDTIESVYWNEMQHAKLEQLAKSLIMAKYNLDFSWFKNFE